MLLCERSMVGRGGNSRNHPGENSGNMWYHMMALNRIRHTTMEYSGCLEAQGPMRRFMAELLHTSYAPRYRKSWTNCIICSETIRWLAGWLKPGFIEPRLVRPVQCEVSILQRMSSVPNRYNHMAECIRDTSNIRCLL